MPLIVPAGGTFSIGTNTVSGNSSSMNMSLDDVIASRRKETVAATRRGGRTRSATSDRAVASGRAKRAAAVNARRNLTTTKKPTKMEVEKEVKTQTARTQKAKANAEKKKAGGRVAATGGRARRTATKAAKVAATTKPRKLPLRSLREGPRPRRLSKLLCRPSRRMDTIFLRGTQMVIRFEAPAGQPASSTAKKPANNNNNARSTARAAGRARAATNNNNNNNRNTRSNTNNNNRRSGGRGRN